MQFKTMTNEQFSDFVDLSTSRFAVLQCKTTGESFESEVKNARLQIMQRLPDGPVTSNNFLRTMVSGGVVVGYLWYLLDKRRNGIWACDLQILDAHRRSGYGRAGMAFFESEARRLGASFIEGSVSGFNEACLRMVEKLGYTSTLRVVRKRV